MNNTKSNIELLAPAGSIEALHAAVCAGADAVYLGLNHFNARRGADNFTLDNLSQACNYAHLRGVKIYLTLNIAIFESEFSQAMKLAEEAANCGVDAFIVQDLGLAVNVAKHIPQVRLHISTQMNIHNEVGLRAVASLGASRVTLARETSLAEIENLCNIGNELGVEIETFGHGALCICYSGQCLMSSMIGGRSANRGTCAQACRLNYELCGGNWHLGAARSAKDERRGAYLLSPKDLCSIEILPQLKRAGVSSLKIEGRMKSADYVFSVASVYRSALNRLNSEGVENYFVYEDELKQLKEAFSRGFTTAYLEGERGNNIMSYQRPNNRGLSIGRVSFVHKNKVVVNCKEDISFGDILEIWTKRGKASFRVDKNCSINNNQLELRCDMTQGEFRYVRKNDRVFRLRSAAGQFTYDKHEPRVPANFHIELKLGKPAKIFCVVHAGKNVLRNEVLGPVVEAARTKEITKEEVVQHVGRLGNTDFKLGSVEVDLDFGVGIGFSTLHKLRNDVLSGLSLKKKANVVSQAYVNSANEDELSLRKVRENSAQINVIATNPKAARLCKRNGADSIYVPALNFKRGTALHAGTSTPEFDSAGYPSGSKIVLPTISHDSIMPSLEAKKNFILDEILPDNLDGKSFLCDSLSTVFDVLSKNGRAEAGQHIPVTNSRTVTFLESIGVEKIWLSPELSVEQIMALTTKFKNVEFGIYIMGAQELMVTEHCELMSIGDCAQKCIDCKRRQTRHYLKDRMGYEFPVVTDCLGRSHIYNSVSLDICHAFTELIDAGVSKFMIDTSLMTSEEAAQNLGRAKSVLNAVLAGKKIDKPKNTTTGHLFRCVI